MTVDNKALNPDWREVVTVRLTVAEWTTLRDAVVNLVGRDAGPVADTLRRCTSLSTEDLKLLVADMMAAVEDLPVRRLR